MIVEIQIMVIECIKNLSQYMYLGQSIRSNSKKNNNNEKIEQNIIDNSSNFTKWKLPISKENCVYSMSESSPIIRLWNLHRHGSFI